MNTEAVMEADATLTRLYAEMEQSTLGEGQAGQLLRRLASRSGCRLYIGVRKPDNIRFFQAAFLCTALSDTVSLPPFRDLLASDELVADTVSGIERRIITLKAPQTGFNDVFTRLVDDVAAETGHPLGESAAAEAFLRRLWQWQRLLQRERGDGLTTEQQTGLYGELHTLMELFLSVGINPRDAVRSWTGPDSAAKDFYLSDGSAIEVKTSLARPPQVVQISNERQLDDTGLATLGLIHHRVERETGCGVTLPEKVDEILDALGSDGEARILFEEKLSEYGYFDVHTARYREGYSVRETRLYEVREGFPRLVPSLLPEGLGAVRYAISEESCEPFRLPLQTLRERIGNDMVTGLENRWTDEQ